MQTAEIKQRWLNFFESKGHTVVPSASLISDDPSLLFTVAGMVPFIPYLTGVVPAPFPRATSVQKCIRTLDIEEVGKTTRHGTFFQMNGNFSFGDYFKREAIGFAWELLTTPEDEGGLGFHPEDLWVTVYEEDDEARQLWREIANIPNERIQARGKSDNYWHTGQPGPAGPCSEIYFDRGPDYGLEGGPEADEDRYIEIWNLVFMQYQIDNVRSKTDFDIVGELPKKNIDTGMGLERVAFLKQGVDNMYEIDQVRPVLDLASEISGRVYGADHEDDVRMRVIADHVRSSLMLISDGVTPANDGRGYILRRLLRRTVRAMRLLGVEEPSMLRLITASKEAMKAAYPEVEQDFERISRIAVAEEAAFLRTLASGEHILDEALEQVEGAHGASLAGDTAFLLHDTYGFPIDLTIEVAEEAGLTVDRDAFDRLMAEQKARAKADAKAKKSTGADMRVYSEFRALGETVFTGYDELTTEGRVLGILRDGQSVPQAVAGERVELILAQTSLYAESGGQDADQGRIVGGNFEAQVLDVQKPVKGLVSHTVEIMSGVVGVDDVAVTEVDREYRFQAAQAHSSTHLVHAAVRQLLGQSAHQAGSYNKAGYMRLDFSWPEALSGETKTEIEDIVNQKIYDNLEVVTRVLPLAEAKSLGAMALFGEKYGDTVRMVDIGGPWSRELCAGTHVSASSEIGVINLVGESSIGATNRRVEALVGFNALKSFAAERTLVSQLSGMLSVPKDQLVQKVQDLSSQLKLAEKKLAQVQADALLGQLPELLAQRTTVGETAFVAANLGRVSSADDVRTLVLKLRERLGTGDAVVALTGEVNGKPVVVVATGPEARARGIRAGQLVKAAATVLGGGGGGKDDLAQGGGVDPAKSDAALDAIRAALTPVA